ncbi:MAG: class I SAM-dependent methyltransferase [Ignavibacteriales bacterium]
MKLQKNEQFFDDISEFYDGMINFGTAIERRKNVLKQLTAGEVRTAADLGCGSGLDSVALALNGIEVTAFDQSDGMIGRAEENASRAGVRVRFIKSSLHRISNSFRDSFDMAISLGNTLANLESERLRETIKKIHLILKADGMAVIQVLNYGGIIKNSERIINITDKDQETFIRFYDFMPGYLNFNILKFNKASHNDRSLYTTKLYPHTKKTFSDMLKEAGFRKIGFYGSLKFEKFEAGSSKDLIIRALK